MGTIADLSDKHKLHPLLPGTLPFMISNSIASFTWEIQVFNSKIHCLSSAQHSYLRASWKDTNYLIGHTQKH